MKLNQIPNFRAEDYPTQQDWISNLFVSLNPFVQSVNQVFNQNVDFTANIKSVSKEYDISSFISFSLQWPFPGVLPVELRVVKALKGEQLTPTILQAAWSFDTTENTITVTRMTEVNESSVSALSGRYKFTIRVTV